MEFLSVKQVAEKWGVSQRYVQRRCTECRIEGAQKFGTAWMIPATSSRPSDRRKAPAPHPHSTKNASEAQDTNARHSIMPMPLMNSSFAFGLMLDTVNSMENLDLKNIAKAEYCFYTGDAQSAVDISAEYINSQQLELKLSALFIYGFASLSIAKTHNTHQAIKQAEKVLFDLDDTACDGDKALAIFVCSSFYTLLHLKRPSYIPELQEYIRFLPAGLRLFAICVQARNAYLNRLYAIAVGIAETALVLENKVYPVPLICLHLQCTMAYMLTPYPKTAKAHLKEAWELAKADDIIEPFGEIHGELSGTLEAVIKKENPTDFRKMIQLAKKHSAGWREIHNELTGNRIPQNLTPTEFTIAMLVARGWTNKEIATHLDISQNTVKKRVAIAMEKMFISKRADFAAIMLP